MNDTTYENEHGCVAPTSIQFSHAHFSGNFVATCTSCKFVCAYWDCVCDLVHECGDVDCVAS